jgi:hypothetical protein
MAYTHPSHDGTFEAQSVAFKKRSNQSSLLCTTPNEILGRILLHTQATTPAECRKSCKVQVRVTSACNHVPALSVAHKHCNRVWALADFTAFTLPLSTSAAMDMLLIVPIHILTSKHPRLFQHLDI